MANRDVWAPFISFKSEHYPKCAGRPDTMNASNGHVLAERTTDVVRPQGRRPKPVNLLDNMTILGYRQTMLSHTRYVKHVKQDSISCANPVATLSRNQTYITYHPNDDTAATLVEPSTAIDVLRKIKSVRVSMAENLGEWKETARAVEGGTSALYNAFKDLGRLARSPKSRWPSELRRMWKGRAPSELSLHTVSSAYVTTQYGVLPYINLANASLEQMLKSEHGLTLVKRIKAARKAEVTTRVSGSAGGELRKTHECRVSTICYVSYYFDIGNFESGNILEAVWAGLPASFMVDWFLGIGQWLSAIDALDGVRSVKGVTSIRKKWINSDTRVQVFKAGFTPSLLTQGVTVGHSYRRDWVNTSMPPLPEWRPSVSWGKLMSSVALLHAMRGR